MDTPAKHLYGCTLIGCSLSSLPLPGPTHKALNAALAARGLSLLARVRVSERAVDLAISFSAHALAVVRCVDLDLAEDHIALETIVAEGDFKWAALLQSTHRPAAAGKGVETFHVSQVAELVDKLHAHLRGAR